MVRQLRSPGFQQRLFGARGVVLRLQRNTLEKPRAPAVIEEFGVQSGLLTPEACKHLLDDIGLRRLIIVKRQIAQYRFRRGHGVPPSSSARRNPENCQRMSG